MSTATVNPAQVPAALDLDGGWSVGERAFERLVTLLRERRARRIVEFGSGSSTVRLALALPEIRVVSVEHDPGFCARTARLVVEHGVADRVELCPAPLGYWWFRGRLFFTYDLELPEGPFDAALIDGPPGYLVTGRQACLHRVFGRLPVGALVVLDDYREPRERRTGARWRAAYPGAFAESELDVGHTMLALEKVRDVEPRWPSATDLLLNYLDNLRSIGGRVRRQLGALAR